MLESSLWNLFYLACTLAMMGFAYYSRHEQIQKLAGFIFLGWVASQGVMHTQFEYLGYVTIDVLGAWYCFEVQRSEWDGPAPGIVFMLFMAMLFLHLMYDRGWLMHQIAYNLLYLAQLATLSRYGRRYGREARKNERPRNDPFYRLLAACTDLKI